MLVARVLVVLSALAALAACETPPADPQGRLIARGRQIFFEETFDGNGRTCATCHRAERNFGIDAAFIATLPNDDPLFVAERIPALRENFENPRLMREFGLILENQDGFGDLERNFNMRGVPHVLAQRTSINSIDGPRTGWSGDGAPGDGTLRSFATGAVIQHFPKTLGRVDGIDFRLPNDEELDALEQFMLSLGRQQDLILPLPLKGTVARRGQEIFLDNALGKCNICHVNAGATADFAGTNIGNANFNTGIEDLPDQPQDLTGELVPPDDGLGIPGDGTFNTPPLVEAADTGPFFHNNAVATIEEAVGFYNSDAFNNSPAGQVLADADPNGVGIQLGPTQVEAVAAFLRVLNALENIRQSIDLLERSLSKRVERKLARELLEQAVHETGDTIRVLEGAGLHPRAIPHLEEAKRLTEEAARRVKRDRIRNAIAQQRMARARLIDIR